jgi:hypothetical protein
MTGLPIYLLLLACGSVMLLGISVASATAQYMRSKEAQAVRVTARRPARR